MNKPKVTWKVNSKQNAGSRWEPYAVIQLETEEGLDFEPLWGAEGVDFATREEADASAEETAKDWLRCFYRRQAMKPKQ
ncbi:MAG: hypothetical protein V2A77_11910 [Pseudomonadota bacterium]